MSALLLLTATASAYTALGTEPFWNLAIDRRRLRLDRLGQRPVVLPRPRLRISADARRFTARGMTVDVVRARCSDGMSDRIFPDRVTVRWRGQVLRGCGGRPRERPGPQ
ncbi:MAG: hypothetical protein PGN23_07730 [Sphingomonas adhaesiva]|uniref:hypothetical protein n=1 Tax=Sphingomonas adhaesiva TaxID=28212 RepID=UPI002FF451B8